MDELKVLVFGLMLVIFGSNIACIQEIEMINEHIESIDHRMEMIDEEIKKHPKEESKVNYKITIISSNSVSQDQVSENEPDLNLTSEEIDALATLVMAEAEGESELGQRLVADTVLNRIDSLYFPDTVHEVIYQQNQFTCIRNGRYSRCYAKPELVGLVEEELYSRTNRDVAFFTAGGYGKYGNHLFQEGHHYFCKDSRT